MNETPERYELSAGGNNDKVIRLNSDLAKSKSFSYGLDSGETANSGIGADFAQRPVMALRFVFSIFFVIKLYRREIFFELL